MKKTKRMILLAVLGAIALIGLIWFLVYTIRFTSKKAYLDYISSYEVEEGSEFSALSDSSKDVDGMVLAAENGNLKLYIKAATGEVAVYDKRSGETIYSNPVAADDDAIANTTNKNYLKSQFILTYFNKSRLESTFNTYADCVELEQLDVQAIENGVRFLYTLGDLSSETGIVPTYIRKTTLDTVLANMSEEGYKYTSKKFVSCDLGDEFLMLLESAKNGAAQIRKLNTYFEEAGFTVDEYAAEMEAAGQEASIPISFMIPLDYTLQEDNLEVSVPMKLVEENGGGSVYKIQLLAFFGAGADDEEGYILVPNGSGSLINFNNGKALAVFGNDYSENVYGNDYLTSEYTVTEVTENCKMPLFGIFRKNEGVFATIEEGASLANITANVAGEVNSYNYVYPTFSFRGSDRLSMFGTTGSEAELPIVETNYYDINVRVRYTFLPGDKSSYYEAANYYRDRLMAEGRLENNAATGDIKFYYDVIGGVEKTKFFLGAQYRGMLAMTTFDQAEQIASDLDSLGVKNQVMNFQGWSKGGYYHDVFSRVSTLSKLGGKSGMEDLSSTLEGLGGTLFADAAFQKVTTVSSNYSANNMTSRYYGTGYIAEFGLVNPTSLRQTSGLGYGENRFYLISPKFLVQYVDKFASKISSYDIGGVSLRDLGNQLHSDKKRTNVINREDALDVVLGQLQKIEDTGKKIMVNDGNDYSFAYADDIINAPLTDNDYYVIDSTVPFYEMLIHGCIDYSGSVINLGNTTDSNDIILNLIETGASPHFVFTWENSNELKETGLNRFYSTTYSSWKDIAANIYIEVNSVLSKVSDAYIVKHEVTDDNVSATTYSNGVVIYVNRTDEDATVDGITVKANSYGVGGE